MKKKSQKKSNIKWRLFSAIIFIILFQTAMFFSVLALSGEFAYIEKFAYDNLTEKTTNRKNYIESEMNQRWSVIVESAEDINQSIQTELSLYDADIEDIKSDRKLNIKLMQSVFEDVVYMMRRCGVNDGFVILDTDNLYGNKNSPAKACLYLRDIDPSENSGKNNSDLLMPIGYSEIAYNNEITFDTGWSMNAEFNSCDENYGFFYDTMRIAEENPNLDLDLLGHWTGFSSISEHSLPSMKYTIPLITDDNKVYGVVGIGITESTLLRKLPSNDLFGENATYIMGSKKTEEEEYKIQMHSGSAYNRLIGSSDILSVKKNISDDIVRFDVSSSLEVVGNIQSIKLYDSDSPYKSEEWVLISAAENSKVLKVYTNFINMLILSLACSIVGGIVVGIIASRQISKPLTDAAAYLSKATPEEHLNFKETNINEIDYLTDAIEELQISVEESASRVSQVIRLVDIGIGVFIYDKVKQNMFTAENCVRMLNFETECKDTTMEISNFTEQLRKLDDNCELFGTGIIDISQMSGKVLKIDDENGHTRWLKFKIVSDEKKILGVVQDITKETVEKKKIEYERDYDITTGLLNRRAYYQKVAEVFRNKDKLKIAAFLMIDLDNLKYVNDTYGHDFGDDYIKTAANILKNFKDYNAIVSRLSGDEFNVFFYGYDSKDDIRDVIEKGRHELLNSYCLLTDGSHYKIRASAGISWYPDDSQSYEQLMKYADFAMYTIKKTVKGSIAEFDIEDYRKDSILVTGIEEMNRIIDERSVKYAFHSIVNAKNGQIFGYEALMRPQSDVLKSPLELIRIAKTGGKLGDIEKLTWECALEDYKTQLEIGNIKPNEKVFINSISNCMLGDECVEMLQNKYKAILPNIVLEVLENEQLTDEFARKKKSLVKEWKAMTALDDFGTGYNSEYALITSNPNIIKIDRSIISGCDNDESRQSIIRNIIKLAKTKNIMVLAEGVETYKEMKIVIKYGVDLLQGYYLARPVFEPNGISEKIIEEIKDIYDNRYNS